MNQQDKSGDANQTGSGESGTPAASNQQGTEAEAKGGKGPARDAAERDWENSAKEDGE